MYFHSPNRKTLAKNIEGSVRGETTTRQTSGSVFLLANSKLHSHLASWQVFIRKPVDSFITVILGAKAEMIAG
jgi:hypothetical protein